MEQEIKEEIIEDFNKTKTTNKKVKVKDFEDKEDSIEKAEDSPVKQENLQESEKANTKKKSKSKKTSINLNDVKEIKKVDLPNKKKKEEAIKEKELQKKIAIRNKEKKFEEAMETLITKRKNTDIIISVFLLLVVLATIFSTVFALINLNNENILNNIFVGDIEISSLSKEEAINKLSLEFNSVADKTISLKLEDYSRDISPNDINFKILAEKTIEKAYNIGRSTNIFKNNFDILKLYLKPTNLTPEYTYDRQLLEETIIDISVKIPGKTIENTYTVNKDKLTINKGKTGVDIVTEELTNQIINSFASLNTNSIITIPTKETSPEPINLEKISSEITKKAKDASYNEKKKIIIPETNGVEFAISLAEAKVVISEDKDSYVIPLKITIPKINTDDIKEKYNLYVFNDVLAKETTYYDATYWSRSTNLELASTVINGTIIKPGEEFSFNSFVGATSAEDGYQLAIGYSGGKSVPMMGGGVCQVSSEIYSAALKLNLQITERFNHVCPVSYLPPGQDATTDLGSCDLRFINNRKEAIKLIIKSGNGVSSVEIRGTKEPNEPVIKLSSTKISTTPFRTIYVEDPSLQQGTEVIDSYGIEGYTSELYKETYVNGILISNELVSIDTYQPLHQVIRRNY